MLVFREFLSQYVVVVFTWVSGSDLDILLLSSYILV